MIFTELVEELSERVGSEHEVTWGFVRSFFDLLVEKLDQGHDIKIRELGTFKWVEVPRKIMPDNTYVEKGLKLKFLPALRLRTRRKTMDEDEGMSKYGVVTEPGEPCKTASRIPNRPTCPKCDRVLDNGGACPKCGTEPFETPR